MAEQYQTKLPSLSAQSSSEELNTALQNLRLSGRQESENKSAIKKELGPKLSGDQKFWEKIKDVSSVERKELEIEWEMERVKTYMEHSSEEAWEESEKRAELTAEMRLKKLLTECASKQSEKRKISPHTTENSWVNFFISSPFGWNIKSTTFGGRDSSVQGNFRTNLIKKQSPAERRPHPDALWEPVLSKWIPSDDIKAAHIFEAYLGENHLEMIFGPEVKGELFTPENGLLLHERVEKEFDAGYFVIIPNLPADASKKMKLDWREQKVKDYKIKILYRPEPGKGPEKYKQGDWRQKWGKLVSHHITWADLDGKVLTFQNDNRPRARYLWWRYVKAIEILKSKEARYSTKTIQQVAGQPYWGSTGPYVRKGMIQHVIEHVGQEFADSVEGADDQSKSGVGSSSFVEVEETTLALVTAKSATASILQNKEK